MDNKSVALSFARKVEAKAGNFKSDGEASYSYDTEIARWLDANRVWITTRKYSKTTTRHCNLILVAVEVENPKAVVIESDVCP